MRTTLLLLVLLLAGVAGFWFGGDTEATVPLLAVVALAVCVLLADLLGPPDSRRSRIGWALAAAGLFAVGWYLAALELQSAYDEAAARGDAVRQELELHRRMHGEYPADLDQLRGIEVPGDRLLRSRVLGYTRTDAGYVLTLTDGHLRATATEETGFFGR